MTLLELLTENNVRLKQPGEDHHVSQGWIGFECPYCGKGSGKYHAAFRIDRPVASCFRCGKLNLGQVLSELIGRSVRECWQLIGQTDREDYRPAKPRPQGKLKLPPHGPLLSVHRRYLQDRGFDPQELQKLWRVAGIGLHERLAWRLLLPVISQEEIVSWTTRATTDSEGIRRYVNANPEEETVPIKHTLLGSHLAQHTVCVCEGPFDAYRLGPGAVATLGLNYSREQLLLLSRYPSRVIVFDAGPTAQQRARNLCEALAVFPGSTKRVELDSADPGSASKKEVKRLRREVFG